MFKWGYCISLCPELTKELSQNLPTINPTPAQLVGVTMKYFAYLERFQIYIKLLIPAGVFKRLTRVIFSNMLSTYTLIQVMAQVIAQ